MPADRAAEIAAALDQVNGRVADACAQAGRRADEITLIVVTKTFPASDVRHLYRLGVRDVGENRDQEAAPKVQETGNLDLRWHFIGQLQSNKARSVAAYASMVHSLDRSSLVTALGKAAEHQNRRLDCLIQVSFDDDPGRGGAPIDLVPALAGQLSEQKWLRLAGVMAVAPPVAQPDRVFARLREISDQLRPAHPEASIISAGMSGDLEAAVRQGATHLRVGGAVLGDRPPLGYRRNAEEV